MSSDEINGGLAKHAKCAKKVFELFNEKEKTPTPEEFKSAFMVVKEGLTPTVSPTKETKSDTAGTSFENPDNLSSKHDNESPKQTFNNFSESEENKPINTSLTFWDVYYEYEAFNSKLNDWTEDREIRDSRNKTISDQDSGCFLVPVLYRNPLFRPGQPATL